MTEQNELEIPVSAKPQADDIVSVNARTAPNENALGKIVFLTAVAIVLIVGMAMVLNMAAKGGKAQQAKANARMGPAAGSVSRRTFETAPPVPGATVSSREAAICADGQPPIFVRGSDGAPVVTSSGPVRICSDGTVLTSNVGYSDLPPAPTPSYSEGNAAPAPGSLTTPQTRPVVRRQDPYAGDVLLTSGRTRIPANASTDADHSELMETSDELSSNSNTTWSRSERIMSVNSEVSAATKVKAARLGDRNMILPKGRTMECGMSVKLVSDLAGQASCILTQNVYSDNGRVVLLERGSEAVGEYRAAMEQGQRRLFVIWTRIKTPKGVIVELNSPGADGLGGSGLPGHVDNHWWQRVGSAFLLSTIQDAIVHASASSENGDTIVFQNTQSAGRQMADRVLEHNINIRPTLYKNQGDRGVIYVARDLDFGDVYALRSR